MSEIRISKLSEYVFYAGEYMKEKFELEGHRSEDTDKIFERLKIKSINVSLLCRKLENLK